MSNFYDASWNTIIKPLLQKEEMRKLSAYIQEERKSFSVFPPQPLVFNAFKLTPFEDVKVVILGQDPYHNIGQAHGLSFSVPEGIAFPPSLRNIFMELEADVEGFVTPKTGDLTRWAKQGVLLLNATLTVRAHQAASHQRRGWEEFTDQIIREISLRLQNVVFILWGAYAQRKSVLIDLDKHHVITSVHPSPLSAYRGFFGSKPFSATNEYLLSHNKTPINWSLV